MKAKIEKKLYGLHSDDDITFVMEDTLRNGMLVATEVKGFYHGPPEPKLIRYYSKQGLKAKYDPMGMEPWNKDIYLKDTKKKARRK